MKFRKKDNARTARLALRLLPEEAAAIEEQARKAGVSTSEFVRRRALGKRIGARYDADAIDAVSRLAEEVGRLREAVSSRDQPFDSEDFRVIGAACVKTLEGMN
jgi:uncharacterized protein (DUF1778 family)